MPGLGGGVERHRAAGPPEEREVGAGVADRGDVGEGDAALRAPVLDETQLVVFVEVPADSTPENAVGDLELRAAHGRESVALLQELGGESPGDRREEHLRSG